MGDTAPIAPAPLTGPAIVGATATASAAGAAQLVHLPPAVFREAVLAMLLVILLGAVDQAIVAVVLPTIARQLPGFEWMAWVISGYLLACTVVTPLYGRFSDLYGRLRMLELAIALFLLGSVACALAQSLPQLVWARVLQGLGGGGLVALAQTVVADIVPLRDRGRYQSYVAVVWAVASVSGPVLGGAITAVLSWPWIFWINVPLCALAWVTTRRSLRTLPVPHLRRRIDWLGIGLLLPGLLAVLLPVTRIGQGLRWDEPLHLAGLLLGPALLALLLRHERRTPEPVLALSIFSYPGVPVVTAMMFINFFIMIALGLLILLRLQWVGGLSAQAAALQILPFSLGIPLAAFISGRWMSATGRVRPLQWLGVAMLPAGLVALALTPPSAPLATALVMIFLGLGSGFQLPAGTLTVQQSVPRELVGAATGLMAFVRLLAGATGVAVLSSALMALLHDALPRLQMQAGGLEHIGSALAVGGSGAVGAGLGFSHSADAAFKWVFLGAAGLALLSLALAPRLPDVRLHGGSRADSRADLHADKP